MRIIAKNIKPGDIVIVDTDPLNYLIVKCVLNFELSIRVNKIEIERDGSFKINENYYEDYYYHNYQEVDIFVMTFEII